VKRTWEVGIDPELGVVDPTAVNAMVGDCLTILDRVGGVVVLAVERAPLRKGGEEHVPIRYRAHWDSFTPAAQPASENGGDPAPEAEPEPETPEPEPAEA
jgi:hypothetical protein